MKMIPNHVGFYVVVLLIVRVANTHGQTGETSSTPPQEATLTYRVPFCCDKNEIFTNGTCVTKKGDFKLDLEVFGGDGTNIYPLQSSEKVKLESYRHLVECDDSAGYARTSLKEERHGLVNNGNLYVEFPDAPETFPPESFCISYDPSNQQKILVCLSLDVSMATVQEMYIPFVIVSTICFIISTGVYIFLLEAKDVHRKCFIGYSVSMIVTFATLLCLQKMNEACNYIGGIFMFSLISSFVWLTCLCMDLTYIVRFQKFQDKTRMYIYIPICLVIPLIIVGYSVLPDQTPDVPQSFVKTGVDSCSFQKVNKEALFIPISLLISASGICLGYTSFVINTHNDPEDFEWIYSKDRYKFMLRSCFLVWVTTFIWLIEAIANETVKNSGFKSAIDLIEAFQGIFVLIIFVLNKYIRKEMISVIYKKKNQKEQEKKYQDLLKTLGQAESGSGGSCRCRTQEEIDIVK